MKKLLLFLFFPVLFFSQTYSISSAERNALVALYNQTDGKNWNRTWDLAKDPKTWFGITIANREVTEIKLSSNHLKGSFPAFVSAFPALKVLDLSSNNLSGTLAGINGLPLQVLNISNNNLSGDISAEIAGLSSLVELGIGSNHFTLGNFETYVSNFPNLEFLDISDTDIQKIPASFVSLSKLKNLVLNNNKISDYSALSLLFSLEELQISGNELPKIPKEISALQYLKSLNLSNNQLTSAAEISSNRQLEWLSLEQNKFINIPQEILQLTNLVHLNLGRNQISGGLSSLNALRNLQQLWLNNNLLEKDFPTELLNNKNLMMLSLRSNNISGELPANLPPITDLSNNRFSLKNIENYLVQNQPSTEFIYSPQRYDEALTLNAALGSSARLSQSLSTAEGYQFSWFKNLEDNLYSSAENYNLNRVSESDFTKYTAEAYIVKPAENYLLELSLFREPITLTSVDALGTNEVQQQDIIIYPNPTSDYLYIKTEQKPESIRIYDLQGNLIRTESKLKINVNTLPSAVYIISLKTEKGFRAFKFIKK